MTVRLAVPIGTLTGTAPRIEGSNGENIRFTLLRLARASTGRPFIPKHALTPIIPCIICIPMTVCFVEPQAFTEEVLCVADDETLRQFEAELAAFAKPA